MMVAQTRLETLYQMRQSGLSLRELGRDFGLSRERIRVLLAKHYGSTGVQGLLTTTEVAQLACCTQRYMVKLARRGIIQPAAEVGRGRKLWQPVTIATIIMYIDSHRCPVCNEHLSSSHWVYCSEACYAEAWRQRRRRERVTKQGHRPHFERIPVAAAY